MLVGAAGPGRGGAVDAALVGERRPADVRLVVVRGDVDDLGHVAGHLGQLAQAARRDRLVLRLELQVGQDADQVGVAAALAVAVDRALDVADAVGDRRQRVGHRQLRVVVAVDAPDHLAAPPARPSAARAADRRPHDRDQLVGQRAAVGVAQDERPRARVAGGPQSGQGVGRDRPCSRRSSARRRRSSRGPRRAGKATESATMARFSSGVAPEDVADVEQPALAEDRHDRRLGRDDGDQVRVRLGAVGAMPSRAEGGQPGVLPWRSSGRRRRSRRPWGWSPASRPRRRPCRTRRDGGRS